MKLLKPAWVNHEGKPIFSVDIHPDGSRLVTGGQGADAGRVVIWSMSPILNEDEEQKENIPKLLCQMDNHLACVNCVRWSSNGKYLASGGDDKVIMIWQFGGRYSGVCATSFGGVTNVEQWKCVTTLRGHSGDILDLSWSPADNWLASCSVDNTIVIWNTLKWNEIVTVLKGHTGLVKGVAWDPIGKYISSQSDDKSLRIWRVTDWSEEAQITEPFTECGGTTHVLRLHWSPDGQFLVSAHAMNNSGSVAQIIERQDWKMTKDYVGHRKAVTCVRFNPNIFYSGISETSRKKQKQCCSAIGSRDRSLSVWLTSRRRPLVVIHDLFDNSVLDISWAQTGFQLVACSWDGTIAFLEFDEGELGIPLSCDEKVVYRQLLYGKTTPATNNEPLLIEDPDMLKIREEQNKLQQNGLQCFSNESSLRDSKMSATIRLLKGPTDRQIETKLADGRRRITPMYIPPNDALVPFNGTQLMFSSSSEAKTKIVIEKKVESTGSSNASNSQQQQVQELNKALPNMSTEPIKVSTTEKVQQSPSSSKSDKKKGLPSASASAEVPQVKRKPGRPPLSYKDTPPGKPVAQTQQTPVNVVQDQVENNVDKQRKASKSSEGRSPNINLTPLKLDKLSTIPIYCKLNEIDLEKRVSVDVENNVNSSNICALRLNENEERKWEVLMSTRISGIAGNEHVIAAACEDNTLSVFNTYTGRRLQAPIVLNAPAGKISCFESDVMIITTKAVLWMWDFEKHKVIIKAESLMPLFVGAGNDVSIVSSGLTNNGSPLICLSTGKAFVFNLQFSSWTLISHVNDLLNYCTDMKPHSFDVSSLPLNTIQSQHRPHKTINKLFSTNSSLQQSGTLSFIDQQLAASFVIGSTNEYKFWVLALAQHLSKENMEFRLRELCQYLLGPVFKSSKSDWSRFILGNDKHEILKEVLSILTSNLRLQRLYNEFKEQLEMMT